MPETPTVQSQSGPVFRLEHLDWYVLAGSAKNVGARSDRFA